MSYDVRVTDQPRRPIVAVAATTTFAEFPGLWRGMLDEVYAWLRPEGPAAATTHRGPYGELGAAHQAVRRWCAEQGREITGENWEVYGDWHEDPAELETEVFYRLRPDSTSASVATA
jgi:hypothetical protein